MLVAALLCVQRNVAPSWPPTTLTNLPYPPTKLHHSLSSSPVTLTDSLTLLRGPPPCPTRHTLFGPLFLIAPLILVSSLFHPSTTFCHPSKRCLNSTRTNQPHAKAVCLTIVRSYFLGLFPLLETISFMSSSVTAEGSSISHSTFLLCHPSSPSSFSAQCWTIPSSRTLIPSLGPSLSAVRKNTLFTHNSCESIHISCTRIYYFLQLSE